MESEKVEMIPEFPEDTQLTEACFRHYSKTMTFSPGEIAFVMVDLWNTGFGPKPLSHLGWEAENNGGKSFCDRAGEIERRRILPMLNAFRELGITVVHAPTGDRREDEGRGGEVKQQPLRCRLIQADLVLFNEIQFSGHVGRLSANFVPP